MRPPTERWAHAGPHRRSAAPRPGPSDGRCWPSRRRRSAPTEDPHNFGGVRGIVAERSDEGLITATRLQPTVQAAGSESSARNLRRRVAEARSAWPPSRVARQRRRGALGALRVTDALQIRLGAGRQHLEQAAERVRRAVLAGVRRRHRRLAGTRPTSRPVLFRDVLALRHGAQLIVVPKPLPSTHRLNCSRARARAAVVGPPPSQRRGGVHCSHGHRTTTQIVRKSPR